MDKKDMPRRREAMELRVRRTMAALEKNNMSAYFAQTSEEAVRLVEGLLCAGDTISCGGSVTLDASGVKALMRSGRYNFLDREAVETDAERQAIYRQTFSADAFLTSSNAITERGELFNIDGGGNRVAAMLFGPKKVIVVGRGVGVGEELHRLPNLVGESGGEDHRLGPGIGLVDVHFHLHVGHLFLW